MSGQGTRKLHEATEAFMHDLEGARWTMMRVAQIQAKMSATMDECLGEFRDMFPTPEQQLDQANQYDNLSTQIQQDLPRFIESGHDSRYEH